MACQIVSTLAIASVLIGVHRYVLLEEQTDRPVWIVPSTYSRFALNLVVPNCYSVPLILLDLVFGPQLKVPLFLFDVV